MKKIIYLLIAILLAFNVWGAGLGISPSIVTVEDMLRGNAYDKYFKALNLQDFEVNATINISGEAAEWIILKDVETGELLPEVISVPGSSDLSFLAVFDIPADAPNGMYEGFIEIRPVATQAVDGSVVSLVVRGFYRIEVTGTEIRKGSVESITTEDTESGQPLRVYYDFRNTGNIAVAPSADVVVYKDGAVIDTFSSDGVMVNAGTFLIQEISWDSSNRGTGTFEVETTVFLDETELANIKLAFNLSARGTLTAEAIIGEISKPDKLKVKEVGKAELKFFNVGKIDVNAKIVGEVMKDDKIVDVISGEEVLIKAGKSEEISFYYKPETEGEYIIKSKVLFSGKEEAIDDFTLEVVSEDEETINKQDFESGNGAVGFLTGLVVVLILAMVIMAYVFTRKSGKIRTKKTKKK